MPSQIRVKVYHVEDQSTKEIRRFAIDEELIGSFEYLLAKIKQVFPGLLRKDVELFWKDDEDDYVNISTDEELIQALNSSLQQSKTLKFYVQCIQKDGKKDKNVYDEVHPGVTCDGCDNSIRGIRYKCMECYDFDLCSLCEKKGNHPSDHEMMVIKTPRRSGNIFVTRVPPFRFSKRGPLKPWFCQRKPRNYGKCPYQGKRDDAQDSKKENESRQREDGTSTNHVKDMIKDLASTFGLDPEVAVSSMRVFLQNYQNQGNGSSNQDSKKEKESDNEKKDEAQVDSSEDYLGEMLGNVMKNFGLNDQVLSDIAQDMNKQMDFEVEEKEKEQSNEASTENHETHKNDSTSDQARAQNRDKVNEEDKDEEMELNEVTRTPRKDEDKLNNDQLNKGNTQPNLDMMNGMAADFFKQFGMGNEQGNQSNIPYSNLSQLEDKFNNDQLNKGSSQPNLDMMNGMAADFLKQLSVGNEQGNQSKLPYSNLGQLMNNIFQNMQPNDASNIQQNDKNEDPKPSSSKSEDYVLVDNGDKENDEERYNQRLEKALKQMEAMGFDNDGGWLRQLLISKELSIARVLDALNP